ncbi:hypothetical protein FMM55_00510 [Campylobacter sp. LR196d]|uniref:hypothetical protein n=1 Tax=Campylobacter sp. LR196d TaxID=2593543 RepID=UPI00123A63D5|nr:hypothetical protein [Campylobacter sp. LR196d]KAA6228948.1 hypothetical protein FMM55_00510 [Campylobacter sp. LR196d]
MYLATYIEDIVDIINSLNNAYLDEYEFMLFVSFLGKNYNGKNLTKDMIINYINEFRNLRARKKIAIEHIANYCNPKNFTGDKINKKDFHNWNNGAQTIFENLNMLGVLEYDKERKSITIRKKI